MVTGPLMNVSRTLLFVHTWRVDLCLLVILSEKDNRSFLFGMCAGLLVDGMGIRIFNSIC